MGDYRPKIEQRIAQELARVAALFAVALCQLTLAPTLWVFRVEYVLVVVICATLLRGLATGLRWGLYGGIALDLLGPLPLGSHLVALVAAAFTVAVMTDGIARDNRLVPVVTVLGASLLYGMIVAGIMSATGRPVAWDRYPFTIMLPVALGNAALTLPIFMLLERASRGNRPDLGLDA